jgi:hypothetical protein
VRWSDSADVTGIGLVNILGLCLCEREREREREKERERGVVCVCLCVCVCVIVGCHGSSVTGVWCVCNMQKRSWKALLRVSGACISLCVNLCVSLCVLICLCVWVCVLNCDKLNGLQVQETPVPFANKNVCVCVFLVVFFRVVYDRERERESE